MKPARALSSIALVALLSASSVTVLSPRIARGQASVGPHAGVDLGIDEYSLGVQGLIPFAQVGPNAQAAAYPNVDLFFFGDSTIVGVDADLVFRFAVNTLPIIPYAGVGLGLTYETLDQFEETTFNFNVLGGVGLDTGAPVEPFVESEASLFGNDTVALIIGLNIIPGYKPRTAEPSTEPPAGTDQRQSP